MKALLDTSVFIARESGRPLATIPDESAISVITLAELHIGVLLAVDPVTRARRLRTLTAVERDFEALDIDAETARIFASILSEARGLGRRPQTMDVWIAATAVRHSAAVITQDSDFDGVPQVTVQKA